MPFTSLALVSAAFVNDRRGTGADLFQQNCLNSSSSSKTPSSASKDTRTHTHTHTHTHRKTHNTHSLSHGLDNRERERERVKKEKVREKLKAGLYTAKKSHRFCLNHISLKTWMQSDIVIKISS